MKDTFYAKKQNLVQHTSIVSSKPIYIVDFSSQEQLQKSIGSLRHQIRFGDTVKGLQTKGEF